MNGRPDPNSERARQARVDRVREVGVCSTRLSLTSETGEAGVDTMRLLFETRDFGPRSFELEQLEGWKLGTIPALGLIWAEGHPAPGGLASPRQLSEAGLAVREQIDDHFGVVRDRGCARLDSTATTRFARPAEARAFLAGMAAVDLPRTETTRRGHPVHSVSWTHPNGARKLGRCYDKGLERGGEAWELARLEDQRRFASGGRPPAEVVSEPGYARSRFEARFGPIRKAVDGVKAASFPVVAQALADEVRYGYRDVLEAERLAGSLVLLTGGAQEAYARPTYYRRRAELRDAGFVVVDDLVEHVEVNLGDVVEASLEADGWNA
jgi:hypothetical protein